MSVEWSIYSESASVTRFSNESFKELIQELKKAGVKFSKMELNSPYNEGVWYPSFCEEILNVMEEVSDRLIMRDPQWIETLPDIVKAIARVAGNDDEMLVIG